MASSYASSFQSELVFWGIVCLVSGAALGWVLHYAWRAPVYPVPRVPDCAPIDEPSPLEPALPRIREFGPFIVVGLHFELRFTEIPPEISPPGGRYRMDLVPRIGGGPVKTAWIDPGTWRESVLPELLQTGRDRWM